MSKDECQCCFCKHERHQASLQHFEEIHARGMARIEARRAAAKEYARSRRLLPRIARGLQTLSQRLGLQP